MLLRWKANNQLELWCNELLTQYSQLIGKLYVYTEVYDEQSTLAVAFSKFNNATQQWDAIEESTTAMLGDKLDGTKGYLFQCYIPQSVMMLDGKVAMVVTAQTPTGYTDANGNTVYQVQSTGLYSFFIEKSFNNGQVPVPSEYNELLQKVQDLDSNVIYIDKFAAQATELPAGAEPTATATKNAQTGVTTLTIGVPAGETGATGQTGAPGQDGEPGKDGHGVVGVSVENGNLIITTEGVDNVDFSIVEGNLIYTF